MLLGGAICDAYDAYKAVVADLGRFVASLRRPTKCCGRVMWQMSFLSLETRRRLYVAFGHRPCQTADVVLEKPVFALQLVVI